MRSRSILDLLSKPDPSQVKLFFGEYGGFIRTDQVEQTANNLKKYSQTNAWYPEEVDYSNDRFYDLPAHVQTKFKRNIAYQSLMDAGVTNGYDEVIALIVTDPAWKLVFKRIGLEESIHAESYSYALNEMIGTEEATKTLDLVYTDPFIKKRMANEVTDFGDVISLVIEQGREDDEAKKAILKMFMRTYILENVKFPHSFLMTFLINKAHGSAVQGATRAIKLIAHDELNFHVPSGRTIIRKLQDELGQGFTHLFESGWFERTFLKMVKQTELEEIEWAEYLIDGEEFQGYNLEIATHFIRYYCKQTIKKVRIQNNPYADEERSDVIKFFQNYKDLDKQNTAAQEAENSSYQKGVMKRDFREGVWVAQWPSNTSNPT